ncbi:MAG: OmpA family protein [Elusimicrobiota bacterium]
MSETRCRFDWRLLGAGLFCAAFAVAACAPKKVVKKDTVESPPSAPADTDAGATSDEGGTLEPDVQFAEEDTFEPAVEVSEASIRGKEFRDIPDLRTITFDYDIYSLTSEARAALRENAAYIKDHPDLEVVVEGHCDERGTLEYNLALGQRRAKAVRDYYMRLGVPGKSVATISFGEERPACGEPSEDCWLRNRRGVTKIRAQVSSNSFDNNVDTP